MSTPPSRCATATDKSGFEFFQQGLLGEAHELAHELLDAGLFAVGAEALGAFLDEQRRSFERGHFDELRSDWVHLQWHMAVFEIGVGTLRAAHERFRRYILPAVEEGIALTDGPSLLWRLSLAGYEHDRLEWTAVRRAALRSATGGEAKRYTQLHNVLAFAGARDVASLDRWLDRTVSGSLCPQQKLLLQVAWALRLYANADFDHSARLLEPVLNQVPTLGGSYGQNRLFGEVQKSASRRSGGTLAA
ncbi:MAG: hypothetical protein AAGK22_05045 [Acidobacteriota bacterium]